ncbi:streptophobe family protein [Streptomyces sp. NPDC048290]|uniref:streptophobe family protein n=1 Tax=Streptomyces sp. NPDC048290 TaxID=3155811 RepID=UPI00343CCF8D
MSVETVRRARRVPWIDVLLSSVAAVSWALIAMAGTAALGLHLLGADAAGSLGPMTAAVVALGAGGSVTPSGDVSAFGLQGAEAATAIEITPLGVSLVGALFLSWVFLRSLRAAGAVVSAAELLARVAGVTGVFVAALGGLAWAGHDVITIDGGALGLGDVPGGGGIGGGWGIGGIEIPGVGDVGDIGGLLPDRVGDLIDAEAAVGFTVDTGATLLGGLCWVLGVLLIALLASRRTPLPRGAAFVHRVVRPGVSSLVSVLLVAVAAGIAAAGYAAIGDDHPRRIAGAALLGAPNGVWLGVPLGLFVPYEGDAVGPLTGFLPHPLDDLLADSDGPVTLARLAELDGRVWLLAVGAGVLMMLAGVLVGVRTPVGASVRTEAASGASGGGGGLLAFVVRCAVPLGVVTAVALPLLGWLARVSVDASLSVLGVDAFGAGIDLRGRAGSAVLLGAGWGVGGGVLGALLAWGAGAAGRGAVRVGADGAVGAGLGAVAGVGGGAGRGVGAPVGRREAEVALGDVRGAVEGAGLHAQGAAEGAGPYAQGAAEGAGPYAPGVPYRPPNPDTNPYLQVPGEVRGRGRGGEASDGEVRRGGASGGEVRRGEASEGEARRREAPGGGAGRGEAPGDRPGVPPADVHGSPTVAGPGVSPAPPPSRRPPTSPEDGPPPPPGRPGGRR